MQSKGSVNTRIQTYLLHYALVEWRLLRPSLVTGVFDFALGTKDKLANVP